MSRAFNVRRLRVEDAGPLVALRREALETDPMAFGSSIADDRGLSLELVRTSLANLEEQAVFGCLEGDHLRGMVGVMRASKVKQRHTGSVWGMYVTPVARSGGAGRALLDAAIRQAREWGLVQLQLGVMETAHAAKRLYEAAGFRSWGREPRALHWEGRFVDEYHLVLDLKEVHRLSTHALRDEVAAFFDSFVEAFSAFSGAGVATLYFVPGVALRGDGSIQCLTSRTDVERFFQAALDGYYRDGCRASRFIDLDVVPMGGRSVLGTVTWQLLGENGGVLKEWRQSYNLVRVEKGWQVLASTYHFG